MKGDTLSIRTANGGGWGNPAERELDRIRDDIKAGFIDVDEAVAAYGVDRKALLTVPDSTG